MCGPLANRQSLSHPSAVHVNQWARRHSFLPIAEQWNHILIIQWKNVFIIHIVRSNNVHSQRFFRDLSAVWRAHRCRREWNESDKRRASKKNVEKTIGRRSAQQTCSFFRRSSTIGCMCIPELCALIFALVLHRLSDHLYRFSSC